MCDEYSAPQVESYLWVLSNETTEEANQFSVLVGHPGTSTGLRLEPTSEKGET